MRGYGVMDLRLAEAVVGEYLFKRRKSARLGDCVWGSAAWSTMRRSIFSQRDLCFVETL
jgi:hypothetical protein